MYLARHHLLNDFVQEGTQKSYEVNQDTWAHFIQEKIIKYLVYIRSGKARTRTHGLEGGM